MKRSSIFISALILLCNLAYAMPPKPQSCPSVGALQSVPFMMAQPSDQGYIAFTMSDYSTNELWGFFVAGIDASSTDEAMQKASDAMNTLSGKPTPLPDEEDDMWLCIYNIGHGYLAVAGEPLPMGVKSATHIIKKIHK